MKNRILSLVVGVLAPLASYAAPVAIANHSFETGAGLPAIGAWNNTDPEGWDSRDDAVSVGMQSDAVAPEGTDGAVFIFIQNDSGSLLQDLTEGLGSVVAPGDVFTLTIAALNQNVSPSFDFDIEDFEGNSLIGGAKTVPVSGPWADYTVEATVTVPSSEVRLVINANGPQIRIDNVRLDLQQGSPRDFMITDISYAPSATPEMVEVTITWNSNADVSYGIEIGETLLDFEEVDDIDAVDVTTTWTETVPMATAKRFYRVTILE